MKSEEISLVIDAFNPDTFPMARLAIYLREYAAMLGNEASIHFRRIGSGSTALVVFPEVHAMPKVEQRLRELWRELPPSRRLRHTELLMICSPRIMQLATFAWGGQSLSSFQEGGGRLWKRSALSGGARV